MALETGSYVGDLIASNPAGTDAKSEGDDHIRLIKKVLRTSFRGLAGPNIPVAGGSANALTLTYDSPPPAGYPEGVNIAFKVALANTGPVTVNVNGAGARSLLYRAVALPAGVLIPGAVVTALYDGTQFHLQGA